MAALRKEDRNIQIPQKKAVTVAQPHSALPSPPPTEWRDEPSHPSADPETTKILPRAPTGERRLCVQGQEALGTAAKVDPARAVAISPPTHTDPLPVPIWALKRSCKRDTSAERMSIPRRTTCKHRTDGVLARSLSPPAHAPERQECRHTLPWERGPFPPSAPRPSALDPHSPG